MLLKDLKNIFHKELDAIYGKEEVTSFFFMCIESFFDISRIQLALDINLSITKEEQIPIFNALDKLSKQKPIQYILGETEFYGLPFKVNEHTLIPRPETEELVDWIVEENKHGGESVVENTEENCLHVLDIGTGSGCIAISLAKNISNASICGIDVSEGALKMAKKNAELNNLQVTFIKTSILDADAVESSLQKQNIESFKMDVVVSNPPYVRNLEKNEMKANVLDNEPHLALFVEDDNALIFYKAITVFAEKHLKSKGQLYFEINEYLANEMIELVQVHGFKDVEVRKDLFGKDRMLKAIKG